MACRLCTTSYFKENTIRKAVRIDRKLRIFERFNDVLQVLGTPASQRQKWKVRLTGLQGHFTSMVPLEEEGKNSS